MVQVFDVSTWPSPRSERLGTLVDPAIRFTRGTYFGALRFTCATACQVARPPLTDRTRSPRPQRAFTSRLPAGRSPFLPLDITTTGLELLCWRDLHPQEWQLASLHQIRTCWDIAGHTRMSPSACQVRRGRQGVRRHGAARADRGHARQGCHPAPGQSTRADTMEQGCLPTSQPRRTLLLQNLSTSGA
jgi:hypothetical protein